MPTTPPKRPAPDDPDDRAPKRPAISSPEEGEVDDGDGPPGPPRSPTPSKPTDKPAGVAFPFKKKASAVPEPISGPAGPAKVIYERSEEDERKFGPNDVQRRRRGGGGGGGGGGRGRSGDSYVPSDAAWDRRSRGAYDSYKPATDTHYRPPAPDWDRPRSPSTPARPSPSPTPKQHRLPAHRSPSIPVAPLSPRRDYDHPRDYDRPREYDPYPDSYRGNSYWPDRPTDPRGHYRREEDDYYRPQYGYARSPYYDRPDTRGYDRERDRDRYEWDRRAPRGGYDSYRRPSPPRRMDTPPAPMHPPPPSMPVNVLVSTPPPPGSPPPPAPPEKRDGLPTQHDTVTISMPKLKPPLPAPVALRPKEERPPPKKRRPVARRSREQEKEIYGRVFVGCGRQDDYQLLTKLGEGTFGEVHKAQQINSNRMVALKRILMHNEKEGMPVTALREIKILKSLKHPSIIDIVDMFVVRSSDKDPLSVYMVFPYMDHDLAGLLENERVKLQPSQIKLYMKQLLEGTEYMHKNHILHRDMKAANLLIDNKGCLRIADFGLARSFDPDVVLLGPNQQRPARDGRQKKYTNCVVTRWYRPPELLLGTRHYGGEIDMWGIGCVLGEMFWRRPILAGTSDLDQLEKIFHMCGTPNQHTWPNYDALPGCEGVKQFQPHPRRIKHVFDSTGSETVDLLEKLLTCNPKERISATDALDHDYFWSDPLPADPSSLPQYDASHEFDKRARRNAPQPAPPVAQMPFQDAPRALPPPTLGHHGGHGGPNHGGNVQTLPPLRYQGGAFQGQPPPPGYALGPHPPGMQHPSGMSHPPPPRHGYSQNRGRGGRGGGPPGGLPPRPLGPPQPGGRGPPPPHHQRNWRGPPPLPPPGPPPGTAPSELNYG